MSVLQVHNGGKKMTNKLTEGEKEILDAIMEQNHRLVALEEWKHKSEMQARQVQAYLNSLSDVPNDDLLEKQIKNWVRSID